MQVNSSLCWAHIFEGMFDADAQADLGISCMHMPVDTLSHGAVLLYQIYILCHSSDDYFRVGHCTIYWEDNILALFLT